MERCPLASVISVWTTNEEVLHSRSYSCQTITKAQTMQYGPLANGDSFASYILECRHVVYLLPVSDTLLTLAASEITKHRAQSRVFFSIQSMKPVTLL